MTFPASKEGKMEWGAKILVVDDELDFIVDLQATLEVEGYEVVAASNRGQAQDMVRYEKPDLIILGAIIPRGDAFLLHEWLKESPSFRDLPIIVVDVPSEKQLLKGWYRGELVRLWAVDY